MYLKGISFFPHLPNSEIAELEERRPETDRAVRDLALDIAKTAPKTIVYLSAGEPSFSDALTVMYQPRIMGKCSDRWLQMKGDLNLLNDFHDRLNEQGVPAVFINDTEAERYHITPVIPQTLNAAVWAVDRVYPDHQSAVIDVGGVDATTLYRAGRILRQAIESGDRKVMIAAVSDPGKTAGFVDAVAEQDTARLMPFFKKTQLGGDLAVAVMAAGAVDGIRTKWQSFARGEATRGIGSLVYDLKNPDPTYESVLKQIERKRTDDHRRLLSQADPYVGLAMAAVEKWVRENQAVDPPAFLEKYRSEEKETVHKMLDPVQRTGVFVTLYKSGEVRGWAGSFHPAADNISQEIVQNAIAAASEDPRFLKIEAEELNQITAKVDVVLEVEDVDQADGIDPKKQGVIVEKGLKASFVMPSPDFNSGIQMIEAAKKRAGIPLGEPDDEREFGGDKLFVKGFSVESHMLD
jgi:AMMECR1 domain-containing protein